VTAKRCCVCTAAISLLWPEIRSEPIFSSTAVYPLLFECSAPPTCHTSPWCHLSIFVLIDLEDAYQQSLLASRMCEQRLRARTPLPKFWSLRLQTVHSRRVEVSLVLRHSQKSVCIRRIEAFEMWIWRRMLKISWTEDQKNDEVLKTAEAKRELMDALRNRQKRWLGHVLRHGSLVRTVLKGRLPGKKGRGRPKNATELATGDKRRGHGLFTTQGASTRADKVESMRTRTYPQGQNTTAEAFVRCSVELVLNNLR